MSLLKKGGGPKTANRKAHLRKGKLSRKEEERQEMEELKRRISETGIKYDVPPSRFRDLPISSKTLQGLDEAHFVELTDIQKCALPIALSGLDVMGTAKTGSGKTLAFLIPILERLYLQKWSHLDGLGALILSPTRELALQTFEVLRKIGRHHTLSAGLVIGGKNLKEEQDAIARMNILVATPGRLLQHMDQTYVFDWSQLQMLVLDEADRILDLGFAKTIDAIVQGLPASRQTLLFSATAPTEALNALARLSMKDPVDMSVHAQQENATPDGLTQRFICCPLDEKLDRLYSFIKTNLKSKMIVFLSSCKQVRFVFEAFCHLQPGVPLMHLHGRQKQGKRMSIFYEFCRRQHAVLFCTDIAARGLDFPSIDWVIQVDCPEDVETYIHRVGRTARFNQKGNALLFLLPSEKPAMVEAFKASKVPIVDMYEGRRDIPPAKRPIRSQLQALCSQDPSIKYLGQKALVSYVRSIHLQSNKNVFKVDQLPIDAFAESLGLPGTPKLRFVDSLRHHQAKNASRQMQAALSDSSDDDDKASKKEPPSQPIRKIDKMFKRKNLDVLSEHFAKLRDRESDAEGDEDAHGGDDLLVVRRRDHEIDISDLPSGEGKVLTSRRQLLKSKKKHLLKSGPRGSHITFDDEDGTHEVLPYERETSFDRDAAGHLATQFISEERKQMQEADKEDAERQRQVRRAARIEKKRKAKEALRSKASGSNKAPRLMDDSEEEYHHDDQDDDNDE